MNLIWLEGWLIGILGVKPLRAGCFGEKKKQTPENAVIFKLYFSVCFPNV